MAAEKKKIGLVLASIHTGISPNVWNGFVRTAAKENLSLFIFPGGKLNARTDYENLRNPVYYLANKENIDALICWSSTIHYKQSVEEFEQFHKNFDSLPYVTLSFKIPGHPCVDCDSYDGMKQLVAHCIQHHNARKLAFLRGPDFHQSAEARFEGFCDAVKEAGSSNGKKSGGGLSMLVTDPFDWGEGEAAAAQLFESRSLIPGRDFDTLIASSDLMALGAIEYFAAKGYHVPADYRAVGFNNSEESRITASSLSTVQLPYQEMASESFNILLGLMGRKKRRTAGDILLNSEVIIRESCGCDGATPNSAEDVLEQMSKDAAAAGLKIPGTPRTESGLYRNIFRIYEQFTIRARYEKEKCNTVLNSLKCELLGTRDRFSLIQNIASRLPKIGINTAAVILYGDEKTSIFAGGFSDEGISSLREHRFPARLLVPATIKSKFSDGVFMVQPLFTENQSLGYFIHNVPLMSDGVIYEELRSAISYALKGIFLLEETIRAKKIAEQAERAKTEFLQTLENGLHDTFQEKKAGSLMDFTLARIDELALQKTIFDPQELLPRLATFPLLSGDKARLAQCFSLVREYYGGGESPDTADDRFESADYTAELTYSGLCITFRGTDKPEKARKNKPEKDRQLGLLLAERIILLHGGEFSYDKTQCTILLPWPCLSGNESAKKPIGPQDHVLVLSDPALLPARFFPLPQIQDIEKARQGGTAIIAWNAAGANSGDMIKAAGLRKRNEFAALPFLCYGLPSGPGGTLDAAASLTDAIEFALRAPKKGSILSIGPAAGSGGWEEMQLNEVCIDSTANFNEAVSEINPSLIIFNAIDPAGAAIVRQHPLTVMVPIVMISDRINIAADVTALGHYSRLLICHRAAVSSPEFKARIQAILGGDEILPPHTGILVKKAILYFDQHAEAHISRWKLADSVNVSEDYLTRIFHKEMGLPLWDYLNRYRIFLAAELLRQTDKSIQDIAFQTGFQDQAYFCRVFKKIYGIPPGQLRKQ